MSKKYKLLLIEDSPELSGLVETLFSIEYPQFDLDVTNSIKGALSKISSGEYDLIITDMMFPSGSIKDVFDRAKATGHKVILLTGMEPALLEEETEGYSDIILGVIRKPFSFEEFIAQFNRIIENFWTESEEQG